MLDTKGARKLVRSLIEQRGNTYVWNSFTNKKANDAHKRNIGFGIYGNTTFTQGELNWIKFLVGCDKVHTTFFEGKEYLRLVGVKFEN